MSASVAKITDYSIYNEPPNILAQFLGTNLIDVLHTCDPQFEEVETTFYDLLTMTSLATATGSQLDVIGVEVGLARNGMNDTDYRAALYIQITLNISCGTPEVIYSLLRDLLGCTNIVLSFLYPAKLIVDQDSGYTEEEIRSYRQNVVPAGVGFGIQCYLIDNNGNNLIDNNGNFIVCTVWE